MTDFLLFLTVCTFAALMISTNGDRFMPFFILCMLAALTIYRIGDTEKPPSHEEFARITEQCFEQRIGDLAFRFPYNIWCAEWVKIKCGDNKYTQQWIDDHIKTEKLAEEEWGN